MAHYSHDWQLFFFFCWGIAFGRAWSWFLAWRGWE
jgi:hypothetical protein